MTTSINKSGTNLIITSPVTQGWKLWIFSKTYVGGGYSTKHIDYPYLALQSARINYGTETETVSIPTMINQYRADVVDYSTGTVLASVEFQVGTTLPVIPCTEGTTRQVKCPTSNKMVTQKCTGNAWITIKDECKEIITPTEDYTTIIVIVVIVVLFMILAWK